MAFILQQQYRCAPSPGANLSRAGSLTFGSALRQNYSLEPGQYVSVYVEPETSRLAIRPHPIGERPEGSAKISALNKGRGCGITIRSIMRRNGILPGRFAATWDSALGLLVLSRLEQPS